jgi:hypothetical protein
MTVYDSLHSLLDYERLLRRMTKETFLLTHWTPSEQRLSDESVWRLSLIQVKVTLRLTVSQSVDLGVEPHLWLMTRYLLLFDS